MKREGPRVLLISEDDDVAEPLAVVLTRAGYRVGVCTGHEGLEELAGAPPDILFLDRDLPPAQYQQAIALLESHAGSASFPLLILGGGASPPLPLGWHEDAALSLARPPQPGEVQAALFALRRLAFYRPYRELVHDLSQPVTALHTLSRSVARNPPADTSAREAVERLAKEADRLMSLLEDFQRKRAGGS